MQRWWLCREVPDTEWSEMAARGWYLSLRSQKCPEKGRKEPESKTSGQTGWLFSNKQRGEQHEVHSYRFRVWSRRDWSRESECVQSRLIAERSLRTTLPTAGAMGPRVGSVPLGPSPWESSLMSVLNPTRSNGYWRYLSLWIHFG